MSRSLNKVQLIGNLGADPEVRSTQNGSRIANLRVATNEKWNDKQGNLQENTEWHRVVMYGNLAEIAEKYLRKGSKLYIEGSIRTSKWEDRDGNTRYTTEITGRNIIMLDGRGDGDFSYSSNDDDGFSSPANNDISDDDIPF